MADANDRQPRGDDPRVQRSLKSLQDAMLTLVDSQTLEQISITALVKAAGVTRPTFYQHFNDINDAARRVALIRLASAFQVPDPFPPRFDFSTDSVRAYVDAQALPVVAHLKEHREFYLRVLDGAGNAAFFDEIVSFIADRFLPDVYEIAARKQAALKDDLMTVMAGGALSLMIRWLRDTASPVSADEMAHRIAAIAATFLAPQPEGIKPNSTKP